MLIPWRGRRHFHKADCLPILSLYNKASVCVCVDPTQQTYLSIADFSLFIHAHSLTMLHEEKSVTIVSGTISCDQGSTILKEELKSMKQHNLALPLRQPPYSQQKM
jgi:hypothetical protein